MDIKKIDALKLLQPLDDKSVDSIWTDPPYYKLLNIEWDKQWKTKDDYLNWLEETIKEPQRVLKYNGVFICLLVVVCHGMAKVLLKQSILMYEIILDGLIQKVWQKDATKKN